MEEAEILSYRENSKTGYFLLTSRTIQDPLENFFSNNVRQKGGYNKNPTVRSFRCSFARISFFSFMKYTELGNCEQDEDIFLDMSDVKMIKNDEKNDAINEKKDAINELQSCQKDETNEKVEMEVEINNSDKQDVPFLDPLEFEDEEDFNAAAELAEIAEFREYELEQAKETVSGEISFNSSLEKCSIVYFAGYLVKRCLETFHCSQCENYLLENKENGKMLSDPVKLLILPC